MNPLTLEVQLLISLVAEGRILGTPWEQLAIDLKRPITDLQTLKFLYPEEWAKQMHTAHEEHQKAGVNQAIRRLGELMASDDLKLKEKATATVARLFATQERAEQRRLKERHLQPRSTPVAVPVEEPLAPPTPPVNPVPPAVRETPPVEPPPPATNNVPPPPARQPRMPKLRVDRNGFPLLC